MADTTVPVPATITRGFGRTAPWTARCGPLSSTETTQAGAKRTLAADILMTVERTDRPPAFARDDDGALIIAIPDVFGGVTMWRVTDAGAVHMGCADGPPERAIGCCHHYTPIPRS
jgi:hypothetical protein